VFEIVRRCKQSTCDVARRLSQTGPSGALNFALDDTTLEARPWPVVQDNARLGQPSNAGLMPFVCRVEVILSVVRRHVNKASALIVTYECTLQQPPWRAHKSRPGEEDGKTMPVAKSSRRTSRSNVKR
jgi:hypothetical protein